MNANTKTISYEIKDNISYIGFGLNSTKSLTTLTEEALNDLSTIIEQVKKDIKSKLTKGVILFSEKKGVFLAGADITMISSLNTESEASKGAMSGQELFNEIEDLKATTVCLVDGFCLGGGMELALSCDFILASDSPKTQLGLPEVQLGLIPGFGGTYRMPRRVGIPKALDLILTGKKVPAKKAKKIGLVDEVYPAERLLTMAPHFINGKKASSSKKSMKENLEKMASDNFISRKIIFQKARESVLKKTKGFYQAPLKILDVLEGGSTKGRKSYLASEAQAFGELCVSEQSKNLIHLFFLMDGSKKIPENFINHLSETNHDEKLSDLKINRGGVLGAGTMGGGIAWLFADNKQAPFMKDINVEALELGLKQSAKNFKAMLKRRKIKQDDFERKQRSIMSQTTYKGFKSIDLVVEAIVENMDIKKKVLAEMEKEVRPDCLITSNTSSLSVTEMAQALEYPERFAGLHFFNPVNRMPLVEIITHDKVSKKTVEALYKWVLSVKKTPVIVKDGPGFLVNRILVPYMNEACHLLEEGVKIKDIDQAILNFGMPMGPCRLMDEVGLDVSTKVGKIMHDALGDKMRPSSFGDSFVEQGLLGKKNGKGFYEYDEKGKEAGINLEMEKIINEKVTSSQDMDEQEIQKRIIMPMINEASVILDEGLVEGPEQVDLSMIFGTGFPPFRGGLLKFADSEGLPRIVEALEKFAKDVDEKRYAPSKYLKELVKSKKKFYAG